MADGVLGHKSARMRRSCITAVSPCSGLPASRLPSSIIRRFWKIPRFTVHLKGPDGTAVRTSSFSDALMAFSQTKYPEEAKKFVKWWAENSGALYTEGCWAYPAKKSLLQRRDLNNKVAQGVLNKIVPTAVPNVPGRSRTFFPGFSQVNGEQTMNYSAQEALNGKVDTMARSPESRQKRSRRQSTSQQKSSDQRGPAL